MKRSEIFLPTLIGLVFVFFMSLLLYFTPGPVRRLVEFLERGTYDWQVTHYHRRLPEDTPILIVDIDDESLNQVGRWPWKREVMGELTSNLFAAGAKGVSFDVMFPEAEGTEEDLKFAEGLKRGTSVLGFAFKDSEEMVGKLPTPFLKIGSGVGLQIGEKNGYLANIPVLQDAVKGSGFLNSSPDPDGVLRESPLLIRRDGDVYGSLGLIGAFLYLGSPPVSLVSAKYRGEEVMEGILVGDRLVPTDPTGKILIPFRGRPYSFPYVSAGAVLQGKIPKEQIENRLVFIGATATSLGDLNPTAIYPIFAGVEVHASIAQGILDGYLPYVPSWHTGAEAAVLFIAGVLSALLLPRGNLATRVVLVSGFPALLLLLNETLWSSYSIVLSMVFPISAVGILFLMNLIWGYCFEVKHRHQIRAVFGQYIPNDRIDQILSGGKDVELQGESKELTVLFADIRGFTSIAEKMDAPELKELLTDFFTPMTEVIFKHRGTIDKYVGDLVMAFWGAPLDDAAHALHAVETALEMQKRLAELDLDWKKRGKPELQLGIGVNTGVMSVGDMGSRFRKAYTVLGDSVNLASRLEGLSKYYKVPIVVGAATVEKTKDQIGYRKLDRVRVLGKEKATEIFEPLGRLDELSAADKKKIEDSSKALEAYFSKNWSLAKELFSARVDLDAVWARRFLERIEVHLKAPPPSDWDGAFILEMK